MSDGLGAEGLPDLRIGLKELVSDGLGAKGLPDLRLGLALAFVFTTPLATLCIENIFSCPVWRALPSPAVAPVGRLVQVAALVLHALGRICLLPVAASGPRGASPLKIFGLFEVFHCPVVYGWNRLVLAAFVTLLPGMPARYLCCVLRRLNYVDSFWRTSAGSALASARCFLWFCITRCRVVSFHSNRFCSVAFVALHGVACYRFGILCW